MSIAQARVVSIEADSVKLSIAEQSACGGCRSKSACGAGSTRDVAIDDSIRQRLRIGDQVEFMMPTSLTLRLALMLYLPPPTGFLVGIILCGLAGGSESASFGAGVLGLAAGFLASRWMSRFVKDQTSPEIRIL